MALLAASCTPANIDREIGVAYLGAKDYDAAISELQKSVSKNPQESSGHFWLGKAYYEKGRYEKAIVHFSKAVELQPDNCSYQVLLGLAYYKTEQYQKAINAYNKAIQINPLDGMYFNQISFCYIKLRLYDKAATAAKAAIALKPDFANNYNFLGYAYGMMQQYDEAFKALRKAIELNPQYADPYGHLGKFSITNRAYGEAEGYLKKAVALQPNNKTYLADLGDAYYKQGRYEDALETVNRSINLSLFAGIGAAIQIVNKYPVIRGTAESGPAKKAGLLSGDTITMIDGEQTKDFTIEKVVRALRGLAGTRVVLTIAREDTTKSLEKTVTRERIFTAAAATEIGSRSLILRQMHKHQEAEKDAKQAYMLNPAATQAQLALGASSLDQGQLPESVNLLSRVKDNTDARILEATAYAQQGNLTQAVAIYSLIPEEKFSPKDVPLQSDRSALLKALKPLHTSKMQHVATLKEQGRYNEALKELGTTLQISDAGESKEILSAISAIITMNPELARLPEEARKYALRGDVLTEEGTLEEAVIEYRKAVQAAPYIANLYFNTAMLYGELKKYPQAIHHMNTYLSLAPGAPNARAAQDQIYKWEFMTQRIK